LIGYRQELYRSQEDPAPGISLLVGPISVGPTNHEDRASTFEDKGLS
jgi:hypothetical protein